jgi:hypothetical protein
MVIRGVQRKVLDTQAERKIDGVPGHAGNRFWSARSGSIEAAKSLYLRQENATVTT